MMYLSELSLKTILKIKHKINPIVVAQCMRQPIREVCKEQINAELTENKNETLRFKQTGDIDILNEWPLKVEQAIRTLSTLTNIKIGAVEVYPTGNNKYIFEIYYDGETPDMGKELEWLYFKYSMSESLINEG